MLAINIDDENRTWVFVHRANAIEKLDQSGGFAANHRLFLFDVIVDGAVRFHLFDLLEARDGAFDGGEIGQRTAEPAFGHIKLAAFLGRFFDGLLRLFFGADKKHFAALADRRGQEVAGCLQLVERAAEVDDMNAIAGIEDEGFHLGIPPFGLVPKMDARIQQFLNSNTNHKFPLVKSPPRPRRPANHPAEHGIDLDVVVATRADPAQATLRPLTLCQPLELQTPARGLNKLAD